MNLRSKRYDSAHNMQVLCLWFPIMPLEKEGAHVLPQGVVRVDWSPAYSELHEK